MEIKKLFSMLTSVIALALFQLLGVPSDQLSVNAIHQFPDVRHGSVAGDR